MSAYSSSMEEKQAVEGLSILAQSKDTTNPITYVCIPIVQYVIVPKPTKILSIYNHTIEDKEYFFGSLWDNNIYTWEPIESFIIDGKYDEVLVNYCKEKNIILK